MYWFLFLKFSILMKPKSSFIKIVYLLLLIMPSPITMLIILFLIYAFICFSFPIPSIPFFKVDCSRFNIMLISTLSYLLYMFTIIVLAFFPVTFLSIKSWLGKTSSQKYRPSFLKNHHSLLPDSLTFFLILY